MDERAGAHGTPTGADPLLQCRSSLSPLQMRHQARGFSDWLKDRGPPTGHATGPHEGEDGAGGHGCCLSRLTSAGLGPTLHVPSSRRLGSPQAGGPRIIPPLLRTHSHYSGGAGI